MKPNPIRNTHTHTQNLYSNPWGKTFLSYTIHNEGRKHWSLFCNESVKMGQVIPSWFPNTLQVDSPPRKRQISFPSTILNYTEQTSSFYIQTFTYMPVINTDFLIQIQHRCSLHYLQWLVDFSASIHALFS